MPMNYATILGCMTTLLGTSTNLIVAGLVVAAGLPALDMFDPLGVGLAALLAGSIYLLTVGRWRLLDLAQWVWDEFSIRSEEHTSELQSLMRISYAVFCLKKKKKTQQKTENTRRWSATEINDNHIEATLN